MSAILMDGKALAQQIRAELKEQVAELKATHGLVPGLVVIIVGDRPDSHVYVRNKQKAAQAVGFRSEVVQLPEQTTQEELLAVVKQYNADETCHGMLVQLPLPKHIDEQLVLQTIAVNKDVDGFHPFNMGRLLLGNGKVFPSTPFGIMKLLDAYHIPLRGKKAVVVGRSNIVGKPIAMLLLQRHATVTIAHSQTENLKALVQEADIVIAAIGQGHFFKADWFKPEAVVIDVGINHDAEGRLIGDVEAAASEVVSHLTPVPGGVGPMTVTMLLHQTLHNTLEHVKEHTHDRKDVLNDNPAEPLS